MKKNENPISIQAFLSSSFKSSMICSPSMIQLSSILGDSFVICEGLSSKTSSSSIERSKNFWMHIGS